MLTYQVQNPCYKFTTKTTFRNYKTLALTTELCMIKINDMKPVYKINSSWIMNYMEYEKPMISHFGPMNTESEIQAGLQEPPVVSHRTIPKPRMEIENSK
ncbi:hypothetical protein R6Q59_001809 [Mikania micrantha]